ncbi:hypothetical protein VaNZ11_007268 [Volvox africanus]|uniref:Uncharacterized protein n=1 Tax=Volvox africanus TaxID=51714 RepID=A0ABQ5S2H0_9CHLO|nr:hypothetical protein VaNZ11_007268 [Volvox africanus]
MGIQSSDPGGPHHHCRQHVRKGDGLHHVQMALFLDPRYNGLIRLTPGLMEAFLNEGIRIVRILQKRRALGMPEATAKAAAAGAGLYGYGFYFFTKDCVNSLAGVQQYWLMLLPNQYHT